MTARLSLDQERVRALGVGREGRRLYYSSDRGGDWQIWELELETGRRRQITENGGTQPVDPRGDGHIYYTKLSRFGIWRIPLDGGEEELLSNLLEFYNQDSWTVTAQGIYLSLIRGSEPSAIYRLPLEGEAIPQRVLAGRGGSDLVSLEDVSEDGSALLLVHWSNSQQDIMISRDW